MEKKKMVTHTKIDMEKIEKPEEWINYGDANPERHGGLFVKWQRDMWQFIKTYHPKELPGNEDMYLFEIGWFEPMDIWVDGNPANGFTEDMEKNLDELSTAAFYLTPENELPEGETIEDMHEWIIDNHIEWLVGSFAHYFSGYYGDWDLKESENYWGFLEDFGIKQENF